MNIDGAVGGTLEKKRVRGKIICKNIHARSFEEREEVTFDKGQAVGPTDKRVSDLTNFSGTIARNPRFIPLSKFLILAEGEKWVMTGLCDAWKRHKRNIKKKYFDKNTTIEQMLQIRPNEIPEVQFRQLIEYWDNEDVQAMCQLNSENRKKQKWRHRMGPINFARSELQNRQSSGETSHVAFRAVFGKEQPGRVRRYGRSVTTSSLKKDEEITKLKQKHANEITSLKEEMKEMMREEMRCLFSQMVKNNPGLDFHDIQGCVGSNIPSPVDASSARAMRGQNLPHSSGSTHAPSLEKVAIVKDIRESMLEEVDFKKEAANVESFKSTKRVLTMERLYGVPLTNLDSIKSLVSSPETSLITALNVW
ncbi:uncharacterized protein [Nicotiana sylvestris]|uniref:uncharacterized protein n=1 Tax=Nicotiana sylvestris TaxID=4096 RepID=UPI00388CD791